MKKSKSSGRWLAEHENDEFVRRAREEGYRSRAVYKLLELDEKYHLLKPGMTVIDLGAAPGGWCQVAVKKLGNKGRVLALDILAMDPIEGVEFIQGDFTEEEPLSALMQKLDGNQADLVISDMAPNLSGMKAVDQPRSVYLVELALDLARQVLKPQGSLLSKCFEGEGVDQLRTDLSRDFKQLNNVKPKASRGRSREIYLLARGFRGS